MLGPCERRDMGLLRVYAAPRYTAGWVDHHPVASGAGTDWPWVGVATTRPLTTDLMGDTWGGPPTQKEHIWRWVHGEHSWSQGRAIQNSTQTQIPDA